VISTVGPFQKAADNAPVVRFAHGTEIIVMRENGLEIRRLAESRSVRFYEDGDSAYWAEPRAAISNDGSLVVADSNFGTVGGVRATIIQTGFYTRSPAVLNAASKSPLIAPGGHATLFGTGLANCTASNVSPTLPLTLCGASVTFNGIPAPLTYASPEQVNVLVPRSLPVQQDATVVLAGGPGGTMQAKVAAARVMEAAPAIFSYALGDGIDRANVQNSAAVLNGPAGAAGVAPAKLGEAQVLFANALGPTDPTVPDGSAAPAGTPLHTLRTVEVLINGVSQAVQFSGLAPGSTGVYQVNFVLNTVTPVFTEGSNFIWVRVNGVESLPLAISIEYSTAGQ
jgi:uncharacterized protein (TIGR03437 family)